MADFAAAMNGVRDRYFIQAVAHAAEVLRAFGTPSEILRLRDIVARTGQTKNSAFRILYTLEKIGLLRKQARTSIARRCTSTVSGSSRSATRRRDRTICFRSR